MRSLVRVVRRSDQSFAAFYWEHLPAVVKFLRKLGVHAADTPDITQQVFLKIYKYWEKPPIDNVGMSLETICRQRAAEHYRLRCNQVEEPQPNVGEDLEAEFDMHENLERHELDQMVQRVLAGMDPQLRDVLVRHVFNDESMESIANAHGVVRNTVYSRLDEAKKIFRLRAERMIGEKRSRMLFVPWVAETLHSDEDVSPEFVGQIHRRVWPALARELGYDEHNPPPLPARGTQNEALQSDTGRIQSAFPPSVNAVEPAPLPTAPRLLQRIGTNPLFLLSVGALSGIAGTLMWPHNSPLIARHTPSVLGDVIVIERSGAPTSPATTAVEVKTAPRLVSFPANFDRETQMLSRARTLIGQAHYTEALAMLRQHEREFPRSEQATVRNRYIDLAQAGQERANAATSKSP